MAIAIIRKTEEADSGAVDDEVRDRVRQGDRDRAITLLMRAYGTPIYRYCRNFIGHDADANDVMQTVFVQAFEGLAGLDDTANLKGWLYGIARHRCLDSLRRRRRRGEETLETDDVAPPIAPPDAPATQAEAGGLAECLDKLDGRMRAALLFRYNEDLSYDEIARLTGDRAGTLRVRVARALPLLRRCLERKGVAL